jgi:hypothetical protein
VFTLNQDARKSQTSHLQSPVAGDRAFRGEVCRLLRNTLGEEFWQGQPPLVALGEQ